MKKYYILTFLLFKSFVLCGMSLEETEESDCWRPDLLKHLLAQTAEPAESVEGAEPVNERHMWFCPKCCPKGEFETKKAHQAGVFKVENRDSHDIRRHCREVHKDDEGLFKSGIVRVFPNEHYTKNNNRRRNEAKSVLQQIFGVNQTVTEADFVSAGMVRIENFEFPENRKRKCTEPDDDQRKRPRKV